MRRTWVVGLFAILALGTRTAGAQKPPDRSNSQFTLRREAVGGPDGENARGRARAGDCAGALPLFDAALRNAGGNGDPSLRRDRGLCHEKQGDPFPAIDDYRYYLTAAPDAPDSDQIRQRLNALEQKSGSGGVSVQATSAPKTTKASEETSTSVYADARGGTRTPKKVAHAIGPKAGEEERDYGYYVEQERIQDEAEKSSLRYGSGLIVGLFVNVPRYYVSDGTTSDLAYSAGGTLRYSTGKIFTLMGEFGLAGIGTSGELSSHSGPAGMIGGELRFAVSKLASDQILVRGGIGAEHLVEKGTRAITNDYLGRFAVGYRHVFGTAIGLEALLDGGPAYFVPEGADGVFGFHVGGSVAFVVGF